MLGFKHLVQCHCILPQYRKLDNPVFHKFIVYSKIDDNDDVVQKIVQCNNCGMAHKIIDFCKSEILLNGEDIHTISIDDIKQSFSEKLCVILDSNKCDLPTWEQAKDILENKMWGSVITLSSQQMSGVTHVKSLVINGVNDFKIEANMRQDDIVRETNE